MNSKKNNVFRGITFPPLADTFGCDISYITVLFTAYEGMP
jgi:hypothetical protein